MSADTTRPVRPPVTYSSAYRFFMPLIFMTELNMISKSVIHAFLARQESPAVALAGFNLGFSFYYTVMSATELTMLICISYLRDRAGLRRILIFLLALLSGPFMFSQLVAFTELGEWIFGGVFGASPAATREAQWTTFILGFSLPPLILRGISFAVLMENNRTVFITAATAVRLIVLGLSILILPSFASGAAAGAAALTICMTFEGVFAFIFAWPHLRRIWQQEPAPPRYSALWSFSWPLALNQISEPGVLLVINLCFAALVDTDLALAAFGVTHGIVSLIFAPLRNLVQTGQTLTRSSDDARVLFWFSVQLVIGFSLLALILFQTPLSDWALSDVMGLEGELKAYVEPAVQWAFVMAVFWALAALFRGWMAGARSTGTLALTGGLRLAVTALVAGLSVLDPMLNGAILGLAAWIAAYAVEASVLALKLRAGAPFVRA